MSTIVPTDADTPTSLIGWLGFLLTGLAAAGLAMQKALKTWAADRVARIADDATSETIEMLRDENRRLSAHNAQLVEMFQDAQMRIVTIASESQRLQGELEELKIKLAQAMSELRR